jgi:uncharacterized protein (TIGR02646 family)
MLKIRDGRLAAAARTKLEQYQAEVDAAPGYEERVKRAKKKFSQRNKSTNATFKAVREKLTQMCNGARRCMYCEDSLADEVEHFKPKDLYPEVVFAWSNYLYACGPCNGPKNNRFAVIDPVRGDLVDVTRPRNAPVTPPVNGEAALIDPRRENPQQYLTLDLRDTLEFTPVTTLSGVSLERARYTIAVLHLNARDYLIAARENALSGFQARLSQYIQRRDAGASARELARLKRGIQRAPHPTVWVEMKRQRQHHPDLDALFNLAPEALNF